MIELKEFIQNDLKIKILDGIFYAFKNNEKVRKNWQLEAVVLINQFGELSQMLSLQSKSPSLLRTTRERLKNHAKACEDQVNCLLKILAPLNLKEIHPVEVQTYLQSIGHRPSSLSGYFSNLFRDWSWGDKENAEAFQLLKSILPIEKNRKILFLGAGGGRLAYDYHQWAQPALTVVNDLNPLLLLVAKQMTDGNSVELYEMPPIPVDELSSAIKQLLKAPQKANENFQYLLGDATKKLFKPDVFDAVVTQWFIDDCGQDIHDLFPKINGLLKTGGTWVNMGPLIYRGGGFASLYSPNETVQIAERSGFKVEDVKNQFMSYMHSPVWRNRREDLVLSFRATKLEDCETAHEEAEPVRAAALDWLSDKSIPVPLMGDIKSAAQAFALMSLVLENIDGKTSTEVIQNRIRQKLGLPDELTAKIVHDMLSGLIYAKLGNPTRSE